MNLATSKQKIIGLFSLYLLGTVIAYLFFDRAVAIEIQTRVSPKIQSVFDFLSYPIEPVLIPMYLLLILKLFETSSRKVHFFIQAGAAMLTNIVLVSLLKYVLSRPRPSVFFTQGLYGIGPFHLGSGYISMPSGHAAAAGLTAGIIWLLAKGKSRFLILLPILFASFRVLSLKHYLSDVILGFGIGYSIMLIFYNLEKTWFEKLKDKLWKNGKIG